MKMSEKLRMGIGYALIVYILLHIVLNMDTVEVFFLFARIKIPTAFLVLSAAAMGAGALFAFQFLKEKKKKDEPKT